MIAAGCRAISSFFFFYYRPNLAIITKFFKSFIFRKRETKMLRKDLLVKLLFVNLARLGNAQSGDFEDATIFDNIEVDYKGDTFTTQRSPSDIFPESASEINEDISEVKETIIVTEEIGDSKQQIEIFEKIVKSEEKMTTRELEKETNEMLVIGLGVGIAALLLCLMLIGACFYIKKRREAQNILSHQKSAPNVHEVHADTFERIDITRGTLPRTKARNSVSKKSSKSSCKTGPEIPTSDLGASSMGTMKTFVNTNTTNPHAAQNSAKQQSEKNWNTSSDVDSIESAKEKMKKSTMENNNRLAKVITYGYQELPTRDGSSFTTSNSSALETKNPASPRQDDSVVEL